MPPIRRPAARKETPLDLFQPTSGVVEEYSDCGSALLHAARNLISSSERPSGRAMNRVYKRLEFPFREMQLSCLFPFCPSFPARHHEQASMRRRRSQSRFAINVYTAVYHRLWLAAAEAAEFLWTVK